MVASTDVVTDFKMGAISLSDLSEIWIYDEETQKWNNRIDEIKQMYIEKC